MRALRSLPEPRPRLPWSLLLALAPATPASAALHPLVATPGGDRTCADEGGDDRYERHCEVREMTLPAGRLEVDAAPNGGIEVHGGNRSEIRIRAKVVARARTAEDARALAAEVRIETAGVVHAVGPRTSRERSFWVSYELLVPEATDLRLEMMNGGLDVSLRGSSWEGEGLDVENTNGGVKVEVPSDFNARLVTGTVNGGMRADFPVTVQGRINHRLDVTLGRGGPTVRAVTTNGGVIIGRR